MMRNSTVSCSVIVALEPKARGPASATYMSHVRSAQQETGVEMIERKQRQGNRVHRTRLV